MREIKFRAWHRVAGEMLFVADSFGTSHPLDCCKYAMEGQPVELMQYTGLKDKNGVEIYEGDIVVRKGLDTDSVEYNDWVNNEDYSNGKDEELESKIPTVKKVVDQVVMDRFPRFWLKNECFGYEGEDLECSSDFEVIGNIYENPELLESK